MKKILSIIICTALLSSGIVFAKTDVTEKVLTSIKSRIPDTESYENFNAYTEDSNGNVFYSFEWNSNLDNDYKHMYITVDENNVIVSLYQYSKGMYESDIAPFDMPTADEMLPRARELCKALNPDIAEKYVIKKASDTELLYKDSFNFTLLRYENNIPVLNDVGSVQISLDGSKILSYNIHYTADAEFSSADNLISPDTAKKAFGEKLGLNLKYRIKEDYQKKSQTPYTIYEVTDKYGKYINASTGDVSELRTDDNYGLYTSNLKEESADMTTSATSAGGSLSEAELTEIENLSNLKTKEELMDIIKSYPFLSSADKLTCSGFRTFADQFSGKYYGTFNFTSDSTEKYENLHVTIDRADGFIKSFSHYKDTYDNSGTGSDTGKAVATEAAQLLSGELFKEYKQTDSGTYKNNFVFKRYVNDIEVEGDVISISTDNEGNISGYNIEYTDIDFPTTDNALSDEEALKKLFEHTPYSVYYINTGENNFIPAYMLEDTSICLDAFTGKQLNYAGEELTEEKVGDYTDISGHWAEETVKALSRFGIGFTENKFLPDQQIKQKEFITLLNSIYTSQYKPLIGAKTDFETIYTLTRNRGIINESETAPDEPLTRDTAAVLLIRCMGAEKYAKLDNIYNCPFGDVTENEGYICILYASGIINGSSDGNFYPKTALTRAEAAAMIYNYLKTIK